MPLDLVAEVRCFFGRRLREVEGEPEDAVDADAGHHRLLDDDFAVGAGKDSAADGGVLAFGVLADDEEVDVAGLAAGERARHAGHQADWPEVDVLVELAAEEDQRAPERDVVGDLFRPADRAEEDGVVVADLFLPVVRQHLAVLQVVVAGGEVELVELEFETELLGGGFENPYAFGDDFAADSVAGDDGYFVAALGLIRMRHDSERLSGSKVWLG